VLKFLVGHARPECIFMLFLFLCSFNLKPSSTLRVILAPFQELSCSPSFTSLSVLPNAAGTTAIPKEMLSSLYFPLIFS